MKESYRKGIANHPDPESCVGRREAAGEALTGAQAGRVLSCEINSTGVPMPFGEAEGRIMGDDIRKPSMDSAQSQAPGMSGNSMRENRETPLPPASSWRAGGRTR